VVKHQNKCMGSAVIARVVVGSRHQANGIGMNHLQAESGDDSGNTPDGAIRVTRRRFKRQQEKEKKELIRSMVQNLAQQKAAQFCRAVGQLNGAAAEAGPRGRFSKTTPAEVLDSASDSDDLPLVTVAQGARSREAVSDIGQARSKQQAKSSGLLPFRRTPPSTPEARKRSARAAELADPTSLTTSVAADEGDPDSNARTQPVTNASKGTAKKTPPKGAVRGSDKERKSGQRGSQSQSASTAALRRRLRTSLIGGVDASMKGGAGEADRQRKQTTKGAQPARASKRQRDGVGELSKTTAAHADHILRNEVTAHGDWTSVARALEAWKGSLHGIQMTSGSLAQISTAAHSLAEAALSLEAHTSCSPATGSAMMDVSASIASAIRHLIVLTVDLVCSELRQQEHLMARLQGSTEEAEAYALQHVAGEAAADLRLLRSASDRGVPLSGILYKVKFQKEMAAVMKELDEMHDRKAVQVDVSLAEGHKADMAVVQMMAACEKLPPAGFYSPIVDVLLNRLGDPLLDGSLLPESLPEIRTAFRSWHTLACHLLQQESRPEHVMPAVALVLAMLSMVRHASERGKEEAGMKLDMHIMQLTKLEQDLQSEEQLLELAGERLEGGGADMQALRQLLEDVKDQSIRQAAVMELVGSVQLDLQEECAKGRASQMAVQLEWERLAMLQEDTAVVTAAQPAAAETGMAQDSQEVLMDASHISLQDLARLDDGQHINDSLLNTFLSVMCKAFSELTAQVHCFNSHFYSKLVSNGAKDGENGWDNVRTWSRGRRRSCPEGIFGCEYLLVPINAGSTHWVLALVCNPRAAVQDALCGCSGVRTHIAYFDSLGPNPDMQAEVHQFLAGYLAREWKEHHGTSGFTYVMENVVGTEVAVPAQRNTSDCGIYVLEFALQLLRRRQSLQAVSRCEPVFFDMPLQPRDRWRAAGKALVEKGDAKLPLLAAW